MGSAHARAFGIGITAIWVALLTRQPEAKAAERETQEVLQLLESLPTWPFCPLVHPEVGEPERRAKAARITELAGKIDAFETSDLREGIALYTKSSTYQESMAFAILQYLFRIPKANEQKASKLMASFTPWTPQSVALPHSWPWVEGDDGKLTFSLLVHAVERKGRSFDPLNMFDTYLEAFGRRKTK